jgi:hypothetical protein
MQTDQAAGTEGTRPARRAPAPRATSPRGERIVAVAIALLVNALAATLLLRAPALRSVDAATADAPIEVVWIERPRPAHPRPPAARAPARAMTRTASSMSPAKVHEALQAVAIPHEAARPVDAPPLRLSLPPAASGVPDAREGHARRGVFGSKPEDPFARSGDGPFRMQDNSLRGRLQRMARYSDCAELRAQLRRGGDVDAVVRTLQERRCNG